MVTMSLPGYVHFIGPLLEYLGTQGFPMQTSVIYEELADRLKISEQDRAELLPSGQPIFKNRIGWAHDALKRAGLSSAPLRGAWRITDAGRGLLAKYRGRLPPEEAARIGNEGRDVPLAELEASSEPRHRPGQESTEAKVRQSQTPNDQINSALKEIRAAVARDLLERIAQLSPTDFEELVLKVLYALGYGGSHDALERVGGSGDGGIDGIISLDKLGFQKVYVQAKRWRNPVGAPEIQGFVGALQLRGADKGVLISSGAITGPAREAARQARGTVILIDGHHLTDLMMDNQVGVTSEIVKLPKIDFDFFESE